MSVKSYSGMKVLHISISNSSLWTDLGTNWDPTFGR